MDNTRLTTKSFAILIIVLILSVSIGGYLYSRDDDDDDEAVSGDDLDFAYENIQVQGSPQNTN